MRPLPAVVGLLLLAGCGQGAAPAAAPPATVTATVTETVVASPDGAGLAPPPSASAAPPPMIDLTVHTDGCGLIREDIDESLYHNLTWQISDADGFQVLGRNALGETRYRYFQGGTYTAVLTAWDGEKYASVSDEVSLTC